MFNDLRQGVIVRFVDIGGFASLDRLSIPVIIRQHY
jgi:hypothetical protein